MFAIIAVLFVGVVVYLWWQWRTTTLTRACRWRVSRRDGVWTCLACGAEVSDPGHQPTDCYRTPER